MQIGPQPRSRSVLVMLLSLGAGVMLLSGCATSAIPTEPSVTTVRPTTAFGFPLGSFAKEPSDPELGSVRLVWTFEEDGGWAEVPFALDGQTLDIPPVHGTFSVDAQTVTITPEDPPDLGTSQHTWRIDGDRLWTTFLTSETADDADWFEMLDTQPWTPVE